MTTEVTLLFPGQGAQYVGMGKNLEGEAAFAYLERANRALGYDLSKIMLEGPEEELTLTMNTQPAILTHSVALLEKVRPILEKKGMKISRVLGHSVGEYAALVAAGVMKFEDAVRAVHLRGKYMQEATPEGVGGMVAVLKVPASVVKLACESVSNENEKVMPANFNDPDQIVISGHKTACDKAVKWLTDNHKDPHRCVELKVSAPFHSSLMKPAAEKLKVELDKIEFAPNQVPYIANIDAKIYEARTSVDTIRDNLFRQVEGSVQWTQSFEKIEDGTLCLEVGPGRVLMGLARKINRNVKVLPLDKEESFQEIEEL